jgi:hypothetical protein
VVTESSTLGYRRTLLDEIYAMVGDVQAVVKPSMAGDERRRGRGWSAASWPFSGDGR